MTTTTQQDADTSLVSDTLGVLHGHDLAVAVLRPSRDAEDDLDLLVAPADVARVLDLLRSDGFVEVPAFGRGTHRFLVRLERRAFVRLDLVTSLDFGPLALWSSEMTSACLARSSDGRGPVRRLDPRDEFWVTLLHLVADDGAESRGSHRLARLAGLAQAVAADPLEDWHRAVSAVLPTTPHEVVRRCAADGAELADSLSELRRATRRRCLREALRSRGAGQIGAAAVLRATEKVRQWPGRRGQLVAVLGPDGAGKSTLVEAVGGAWLWPHQRVYFGLWPEEHDSAGLAKALWPLRRPPRALGRYVIGLLGAARGRLVLFDRYVYDAAVPPRGRFRGLKRFYFSILLHCVPSPDMAVLLEAPGEVLHARKGEMTPEALDENRDAIASYVRAVHGRTGRPRVVTVDATQDLPAVVEDVLAAIWRTASRRLDRTMGGER